MSVNIKRKLCIFLMLFLVGISIIIIIFSSDLSDAIPITLYNIITCFLLLVYAEIIKIREDFRRKILAGLLWYWSFWYSTYNSIGDVIKLFF